jgi:LPXTG-motif cell wall-anchored protein
MLERTRRVERAIADGLRLAVTLVMSRPKLFSAIFLTTALGVATPAFAQPEGASQAAQRDTDDGDDNSGMLGLLGLLGGLGLLGLKRRRAEEPHVRRTNTPVGAH